MLVVCADLSNLVEEVPDAAIDGLGYEVSCVTCTCEHVESYWYPISIGYGEPACQHAACARHDCCFEQQALYYSLERVIHTYVTHVHVLTAPLFMWDASPSFAPAH